MLGRGLVVLAIVLAAGSARAAPDDEIEMDPETKPDAKTDAKPDAKTDAKTDAKPDGPVKDPKIAKKWLTAAQQLVSKGDLLARQKKPDDAKQQWENAVIAYNKAIEAGLDVVVWADLASVEDKLANAPDAVKHYKLALAVPNLKPAVQKQLNAKLDELLGKVGLVTLTIIPDDTKVTMGEIEIGTSPLKEPLVLAPGTYSLSFTATGYEPRQAELKVEAGSESERKIELEAKKPVIETVEKEPEAPPPAKPVTPTWPLYAGAGTTGGLLLFGTVTGIVAVSKHGTLTSRTSTPQERRDAQSSGPTYAHITDVCLTGAVLAGAFTAYYYLYKYKPSLAKEAPAATSKLDLAPWVQPDAGGLVVGGRF